MNKQRCSVCNLDMPGDAFRKGSEGVCVWCQWASPEKRARARYKDKDKADKKHKRDADRQRTTRRRIDDKFKDGRLRITEKEFVDWYVSEPDCCHYCGITLPEVKNLRLKRGGFGYFVSWDIDRKDSNKPYEQGNLALACFMCNMAKGSYFTESEARALGETIHNIVEARLKIVRDQATQHESRCGLTTGE